MFSTSLSVETGACLAFLQMPYAVGNKDAHQPEMNSPRVGMISGKFLQTWEICDVEPGDKSNDKQSIHVNRDAKRKPLCYQDREEFGYQIQMGIQTRQKRHGYTNLKWTPRPAGKSQRLFQHSDAFTGGLTDEDRCSLRFKCVAYFACFSVCFSLGFTGDIPYSSDLDC